MQPAGHIEANRWVGNVGSETENTNFNNKNIPKYTNNKKIFKENTRPVYPLLLKTNNKKIQEGTTTQKKY